MDKRKPIPKYRQLIKDLKISLLSGTLAPGDRFPSENELSAMYGVSNITVRQAVRSLKNEGLIYRIQGKGTFIAERKREHLTIGLVIPHLHLELTDFFVPLIRAIEDEAKRNDAHLILCVDNDDAAMERQNLVSLAERKVDGVILFYIGEAENIQCLQQFQSAGIPFVLIDRYLPEIETDYVVTRNLGASRCMTRYLLDKGFDNTFFFTTPETCSTIKDRVDGYKTALDDAGISINGRVKASRATTSYRSQEEEAYLLAMNTLKNISGRVGVVAVNHPNISGIWKAVSEIGISPRDIAIACFDEPPSEIPEDVEMVRMLQPLKEMGRKSVQAIISRLGGRQEQCRLELEPQILCGRSPVTGDFQVELNADGLVATH